MIRMTGEVLRMSGKNAGVVASFERRRPCLRRERDARMRAWGKGAEAWTWGDRPPTHDR